MAEQFLIIFFSIICVALSVAMLFSKNVLTAALCLLGILVNTAGIYGVIGEHFVAAIQLVVYAGAIMVLFIFSIMLLNLRNDSELDFKISSLHTSLAVFGVFNIFIVLWRSFKALDSVPGQNPFLGDFTREKIYELGGNSKVLSYALFSQHYLSFELVSIALIVALVGAVLLAKRKID